MSSKGRPRRIDEPTRTYNVLFPVSLLEAVKERAQQEAVSTPTLMRQALENYLGAKPVSGSAYRDGVNDALALVEKSSRLRMKTATGQTMGEVIARQIDKELA